MGLEANQVRDTEGAWAAGRQLGQFTVNVPRPIYVADMDTDPGWSLEPRWEYGLPTYTGSGPKAGFTGTHIVAYNLSGNYENRLTTKYATTPVIDGSSASTLTLRFRRWLRLRFGDTARTQVSTNGTAWANVWTTSSSVTDSAWQTVQYTLPAWAAGSPSLRLRWGLASNSAQTDLGWNLDDVELLGGGKLDATPPTPLLLAADLTTDGSPNHSFTVTFTDESDVRVETLSSANLLVTSTNGLPLWQSYLAGLDPNNPNDQLRLRWALINQPPALRLDWHTVNGRVYTVRFSPNLAIPSSPLPGAANLPWTVSGYTHALDPSSPVGFYQLEVRRTE
ncbi:MAG: hypothetical protein FJ387_21915 [Verrucomicrobia bacterium]|nr:hypothetical protein [Verrucomicrobiota bacterium]